MHVDAQPRTWKVLLAFAIIYFVWGSTFLAIRVGVREVPPFLLAGMCFLVAGLVLYIWTRARGTPSPTVREWSGASLLAILIFVLDYGLLFWAERRVPSGIAAVMMATIPVFMTLAEIAFLRTQRLTIRLAFALLVGMAGVAVLVGHTMSLGEAPVDTAGACALIVSAISWSTAASLSRKVPLPAAKTMSSGAQMLAGGVLLTLTAGLLGEFRGFHMQAVSRGAWLALVYLIVAGWSRIRSSASSHWSTFEVISHVWTSLKIVSPVKTTRSSGTWTASWPGVWPGVHRQWNVWSPTRRVRSPVNTTVPRGKAA